MKYLALILTGILGLVIIAVLVSGGGFLVDQGGKDMRALPTGPLPIEGRAPELAGITGWINTEPLTLEALRSKVVLVDFWTYSCINCIRTFPYLRAWHERYKDYGFVLLGVHTPEFQFEKDIKNVRREAREHALTYPIALDNDYKTWSAFRNRFWPAHYLIDTEGNIRYHHFGEGQYAHTEQAVQQLLLEAGLITADQLQEIEAPLLTADFTQIKTPEIYLGYARINNIGNPLGEVPPDLPHAFTAPATPAFNMFYLDGRWTIHREFAELIDTSGKIVLRYSASKVNMVLETSEDIVLTVFLDGVQHKQVTVNEATLYNLVDTGNEYGEHIVEILIPESGLKAFTFTFG